MSEDRLAIRLALIRRATDNAIRHGTKLNPHTIRAMTNGEKG